jgi:hypothetical protein
MAQGAQDAMAPPPLHRSATTGHMKFSSSSNPYKNNQFARKAALVKISEDQQLGGLSDRDTENIPPEPSGLQRRATDAGRVPNKNTYPSRSPPQLPDINTKAALLRSNTFSPRLLRSPNQFASMSMEERRFPSTVSAELSGSPRLPSNEYFSDFFAGNAPNGGGGSMNSAGSISAPGTPALAISPGRKSGSPAPLVSCGILHVSFLAMRPVNELPSHNYRSSRSLILS